MAAGFADEPQRRVDWESGLADAGSLCLSTAMRASSATAPAAVPGAAFAHLISTASSPMPPCNPASAPAQKSSADLKSRSCLMVWRSVDYRGEVERNTSGFETRNSEYGPDPLSNACGLLEVPGYKRHGSVFRVGLVWELFSRFSDNIAIIDYRFYFRDRRYRLSGLIRILFILCRNCDLDWINNELRVKSYTGKKDNEDKKQSE